MEVHLRSRGLRGDFIADIDVCWGFVSVRTDDFVISGLKLVSIDSKLYYFRWSQLTVAPL